MGSPSYDSKRGPVHPGLASLHSQPVSSPNVVAHRRDLAHRQDDHSGPDRF